MSKVVKAYILQAVFYILSASTAAAVTYVLPGTYEKEAFVDVMAIMVSIAFYGFGTAYAVLAYTLQLQAAGLE